MGQSQSAPLDLLKYSGRWYELARTPNPFEQDCRRVFSDYIQTPQGFVLVNTCFDENKNWRQGLAIGDPLFDGFRVRLQYELSPSGGNYLSVPPGDYRVLWTNYTGFSFVRSDSYFWIFSRDPVIDQKDALIAQTIALGYNPQELIWSEFTV